MASNSGWTTGLPSGSSAIRHGDDEFRSLKSYMEAWWEQEHYATSGSATSAGIAKKGAGRAFVGASSALSNPTADNDGRFFWNTQNATLYVGQVSSSSWSAIADGIDLTSNQSWTGIQQFSQVSLSAGSFAVGGAFTGVVSGITNLAAVLGIAVGDFPPIKMVNTGSRLTTGDVISVGVILDANTANNTNFVLHSAGIDPSDGSVQILFHNAGSSVATFASGTTVRYIGFASI